MFVCGITGTGKSNLIQYFLLTFTKHYDISFLLTEFKGEYQFLQKKIKDLLILKPGENFSINIFDPEGADPEVFMDIENYYPVYAYTHSCWDNSPRCPNCNKLITEIKGFNVGLVKLKCPYCGYRKIK